MAFLRIKGIPKLYEIDHKAAQKIRAMLEDDSVKNFQLISLDTISVRKGDITTVILDEELSNAMQNKWAGKVKEWDDYVARQLSFPPAQRAEDNYGMFELLWWAFTTSVNVPDEIWQKAKQMAADYFINHPYRIICDVGIWKPLLKENYAEKSYKESSLTLEPHLRERAMHYIALCMDRELERTHDYYSSPPRQEKVIDEIPF